VLFKANICKFRVYGKDHGIIHDLIMHTLSNKINLKHRQTSEVIVIRLISHSISNSLKMRQYKVI